MKAKHAIIISIVVGLIAGGYLWFKRQMKLLTSMTYKVKDLRIRPAGGSQLRLDFNLVLSNPSDVGITVKDYDLEVSGNGTFISRVLGKNGVDIVIPAKGQTLVPLSLTFIPKEVGNALLSLALDTLTRAQLTIRVQGTLTAAVGTTGLLVSRNVPVDYSNNLLPTGEETT